MVKKIMSFFKLRKLLLEMVSALVVNGENMLMVCSRFSSAGQLAAEQKNNREVKHDVYGKRQTAKIILILLTFSLALK